MFLAEVIKLHGMYFYQITPYSKFTVLKSMYTPLPYWKLVARKMFKSQYRITKFIVFLIQQG